MRLPLCLQRIQNVRDYRLKSKRAQTLKAAQTPQNFDIEVIHRSTALIIPKVSSERRRYIPLGFVNAEALYSNTVKLIPEATLYHFGVLHSKAHNAWMRTVAGRLKSDYQYAVGLVYNTFIWPDANPHQKADIKAKAQSILDAREQYPDATIAQMYDTDLEWLYPELIKALDEAVEREYGLPAGVRGEGYRVSPVRAVRRGD